MVVEEINLLWVPEIELWLLGHPASSLISKDAVFGHCHIMLKLVLSSIFVCALYRVLNKNITYPLNIIKKLLVVLLIYKSLISINCTLF